MNNKKHLTTFASAAILLAITGVGAATAQAATTRSNAPVHMEDSTGLIGGSADTGKPTMGLNLRSELPLSPASQQNAVRSAEDYLETSSFSRQGLIEQLEYEGFSTEDATFAVDHITVDWNEQAAKSAKDYLEMSGFSRSGLIDQLEYEGFTPAQAAYGVTAAGL
ncbi:Ltp family lipoprotein [Mycobacterium sp. 3519A]|uniref:Ltp family lipoprotein n=1 Tax=Mycobacterium sp. 3519A TaxID=2057184 RepID=UPI001F15C4C4|nr:Ltp family lipoprotein [Mycobacterium sp. 3519A]